ncbi:hypothetical protein [Acidithiobacillus ferriphilus]|uniref:hypothetical protein n=1 Tax=Acidithiobacillus ferriphilus TaxID=1689834 RepID=UPI00232DCD25|nr:hypothetical protein [Acidithiobacillus ferriphilus]WCE94108.1 hypothetical protein PJU76_00785 [Acidithiobacillus ferriphilus]
MNVTGIISAILPGKTPKTLDLSPNILVMIRVFSGARPATNSLAAKDEMRWALPIIVSSGV